MQAACVVEECEEGVDDFGGGEYLEFVGVFDVHDFVADVVGGFDDEYEGMAGVAQCAGWRRQAEHAGLGGDADEAFALAGEESEFAARGECGLEGVFDD